MTKVISILLATVRAGVFLVPLMALVSAYDPWWTPWLSPDIALPPPQIMFPDVVLRAAVFRMLVEALVVAWVALAILEPRYRPRSSLLLWSTVGFVAVVALVDVTGVYPTRSLWSNLERMAGLESLLHLLAFFVVAGSVLDSERLWQRFFQVSIAAAAVTAVLVWLQWLGIVPLHAVGLADQWFRADARLGSAVFLAVYLQLHLFLVALFLLRAVGGGRLRVAAGYGALVLLLYSAVYLTGTRSATFFAVPLGVATIALAAVLQNPARARVRRAATVTFVVVGCLALAMIVLWVTKPAFLWEQPALKRLLTAMNALTTRFQIWDVALQGFLERPLLGWGEQNFSYVFDRLYPPSLWNEGLYWDHPHNVWLGWLVAGGLVGLAGYACWFAAPFVVLWRRRGRWLSTIDRSVITGLLVSYGLFDLFVFDTLTSLLVFLSIGAWLHSGSIERPAAAATVSRLWLRLPMAALATGVATLLAVQGWRHQEETVWAAHRIVVAAAQPMTVEQPSGRLRPTLLDTLQDAKGTIALREARKQAAVSALETEALPDIIAAIKSGFPRASKEEINRMARDYQVRLYDLVVTELEDQVHEDEAYAGPSIETLLLLGMTLVRHDRAADAAFWLERARDLGPKRQWTLYQLGEAYFGLGRLDDALAAFEQAWKLWPENHEAKLRYCAAAIRAGHDDLADRLLAELYPAEGIQHLPDDRIVDALLQNDGAARALPLYERVARRARDLYRAHKVSAEYLLKSYTSLILVADRAHLRQRTENFIHSAMAQLPTFRRHGQFLLDSLERGESLSFRVEPGTWHLIYPPEQYRPDLLPQK